MTSCSTAGSGEIEEREFHWIISLQLTAEEPRPIPFSLMRRDISYIVMLQQAAMLWTLAGIRSNSFFWRPFTEFQAALSVRLHPSLAALREIVTAMELFTNS